MKASLHVAAFMLLLSLSAGCVYLGAPPFLREQIAREAAHGIAMERKFGLACEALRRAGVEWDDDDADSLLYRDGKLVGYVFAHPWAPETPADIESFASEYWAPYCRDARARGAVFYLAIPEDLRPELAVKVREELKAREIEAEFVTYRVTP